MTHHKAWGEERFGVLDCVGYRLGYREGGLTFPLAVKKSMGL
jgi:hypothetical protein